VDLLPAHGFTAFRGSSGEQFLALPAALRKPLRMVYRTLGLAAPPQRPLVGRDGLVELPASMLFALPTGSLGSTVVGPRSLARRAVRGLRRAARQGSMFQIYLHDHNLGVRPRELLAALDTLLRAAGRLRDEGRIRILTMGEYAASLAPAADLRPGATE
jgi:hypothetical protein